MSTKENNDGYKVLMQLWSNELKNDNHPPAFFLGRPNIRAVYTFISGEATDDVHLSYFKEPKATTYPLDLNKGFNRFIFRRRLTPSQMLDKVLKFVLESEDNVLQPTLQNPQACNTSSSVSDTECRKKTQLKSKRKVVLSQRGVLTRIMLVPYRLKPSEYNNTTFFATRYCGILHLADLDWRDQQTKNDSYHGKFTQACFSDDPDLDPITSVPVDENNITFGIYHTTMKEFDLIYSAEIAGIVSDHKIADIHNMDEINECRFILSKLLWSKEQRGDILNHPKVLLWWLQCYLANTNDICIGLKDSDGVVRMPVQLQRVQDIPKNRYWKPHICIRFLHTLLVKVEEVMASVNCPYTVYEFVYDSNSRCIKFKIYKGKSEYSFLSKKYIKHCKEKTKPK